VPSRKFDQGSKRGRESRPSQENISGLLGYGRATNESYFTGAVDSGQIQPLEDAYDTERQLLYVAASRARDRLLVTGVKPGSEFLRDMES
jgi:superfamily I DNA/RNA helicase